jgi:hypothetical protein
VQRPTRTPWIRGLRLYRTLGDDLSLACDDAIDPMHERHVHARSRFRSVTHPDRFALYSVHERGEMLGGSVTPGDHTLVTVREFRRVPLHASALGLLLFAARAGREAQVVATLAHFAERALSVFQPPYLLLARSMEQPGITVLLAGVQSSAMLDSCGASVFSVASLLPELESALVVDPEWYQYAPDLAPTSVPLISPHAV